MIAFYGMGLLGGNFVRALRKRGEDVRVWNRSPGKAQALADTGAVPCADPADAARGATRVHLTLTDDAAVDEVLERARPGFAPGVTIVDHSTCSPAGTAARAARWAERGVAFQHAPVFMGPANALAGTGLMLASGDRARFDALEPALAAMTGKLVYVGPVAERAAALKLLGNLFLMMFTAGVTESLALAKALGVPLAEVATLFEHFNPGTSLSARVARVSAGEFDKASWELAMARKDARLMLEAAGGTLAVLPALAAEMDRWIAKGHAHDDWTVIGKDAVT